MPVLVAFDSFLTTLLGGWAALRAGEHVVIGGEDLLATNSKDMPNRVAPRTSTQHRLDGTQLSIELPKISWTMTRFRPVTGDWLDSSEPSQRGSRTRPL